MRGVVFRQYPHFEGESRRIRMEGDKFVEVETFIALCEKLAPKTIDKVQTNMV